MTMEARATSLMVFPADPVAVLIEKGEVTDRYYNPKNLFSVVHMMLNRGDNPSISSLQRMVGHAQLHVHHYDLPGWSLLRAAVWNPRVLRIVMSRQIQRAAAHRPDVVRAFGHFLNAALASHVADAAEAPLVVSLHGNPDVDYFRGRLA